MWWDGSLPPLATQTVRADPALLLDPRGPSRPPGDTDSLSPLFGAAQAVGCPGSQPSPGISCFHFPFHLLCKNISLEKVFQGKHQDTARTTAACRAGQTVPRAAVPACCQGWIPWYSGGSGAGGDPLLCPAGAPERPGPEVDDAGAAGQWLQLRRGCAARG